LIGNLTRDPELRYLASGMAICKFGLAVNDRVKKGDEWTEKVNFIDIVVWGKQGENCSEYLSKGRSACVDGRLTYSSWETDDGQKRSKLEVTAERVVFLGGRGGEAPDNRGGSYGGPDQPPADDDVPF